MPPLSPDEIRDVLVILTNALTGVKVCLTAADQALATLIEHFTDDAGAELSLPLVATPNPETCHHPAYFDVLGQHICETCGATHRSDGTWAVIA